MSPKECARCSEKSGERETAAVSYRPASFISKPPCPFRIENIGPRAPRDAPTGWPNRLDRREMRMSTQCGDARRGDPRSGADRWRGWVGHRFDTNGSGGRGGGESARVTVHVPTGADFQENLRGVVHVRRPNGEDARRGASHRDSVPFRSGAAVATPPARIPSSMMPLHNGQTAPECTGTPLEEKTRWTRRSGSGWTRVGSKQPFCFSCGRGHA